MKYQFSVLTLFFLSPLRFFAPSQLQNSIERFQMPEDLPRIEQARELAMREIEEARKELKHGNIEDSVRSLMEVSIMVFTSMRRERQVSC